MIENEKTSRQTALIILNYNNIEDTFNCIESVEKYNTAKIKLIVIDNGSTREGATSKLGKYMQERYGENFLHMNDEELRERIGRKCTLPYATYIESSTNDGYAKGNDKGLYLTECDDDIDFVMILNNDVLFVQDIIPELLRQYSILHDVAVISPILYKKDMDGIDRNCARLQRNYAAEITTNFFYYFFRLFGKQNPLDEKRYLIKDENKVPEILNIELPSGSCMLIRKELFSRIGFFDRNTFLYFEEDIIFKKLKKLGLKNYLVSTLKCIHLGASSTSKTPGFFAARCYYNSRRYYMKNYAGLSNWQYTFFKFSQNFHYQTFLLQKHLYALLGIQKRQ